MTSLISVAFLIFGCFNVAIECRTSNSLRVTLPNGSKVLGRYLTSHDGHGIRAFLGVPYAEPPVGALRFKPPQPKAPWDGELQATSDPSYCIQRDPYRRDEEVSGSEDCLYLNVYAPAKEITKPLAVMVFFHGGGFMCGSGIRGFYGPDHLLDHDVVYIGANYRLGPLGFLSTGQEDCPGNWGLKDQVQVLRWIQENIEAFGGDRNSVTVFGESAGGASATYLMMSPLSEGLFHKAIAQSGTNLDPWSQPAHDGVAPKRAGELAKKFGCLKSQWSDTIECLRAAPADKVTNAFYDFYTWDMDPMIPFPPVIEPDLPGAFITKHPREVTEPHAIQIPFMTGLTADEGAMKSAPIINIPELYEDFNARRELALPISLNYDHHSTEVQRDITQKINKFYFNNEPLSPKTHQNLTNLFTDGWFLCGTDEYLRIRLLGKKNIQPGPTYVYLFTHKAAASFTEIFRGGRENYYGVCHAEELQYLFPIAGELFVSAIPTEKDHKIRKVITELWVNFARTGNPTPDSSDLPKWPPTAKYPLDYYRIGDKDFEGQPLVAMEKGLMEERAAFWRNLKAHLPSRRHVDGEGKDEL